MLRHAIVPVAQPAANAPGGGAATAAATPTAAPAGTATNPTASAAPLIPTDKPVSTFDRIKMTIEQERQREAEIAKAKQTDEERKAALDKMSMATTQQTMYGELATNPDKKGENRFAVKRDLDKLRTDPGLTEVERNEKLKKLEIFFKEDKRGKLGKAVLYHGDAVERIVFADTPENRYRQKMLDVAANDLAGQLELAKIVFDARLFKVAAEHLSGMRRAKLVSPEMFVMLADALHEQHDYNQEVDVLRQATKQFAESAPLQARYGRLLALVGLGPDAEAAFRSALAKNASDPIANTGLAELLLKNGDARGAVGYLRDALNTAVEDPLKVDAIRLLLAEAYIAQGDFKNAHETLDLVLARTATTPAYARIFERASTLSAVAALGQNNLAEARTRAEDGAKKYPLSGQLSLLLGIVMLQQNDIAGARTRIQTAMELDPLLTGHAQVALAIADETAAEDVNAVADAEAGAIIASPGAIDLRLPFGRTLLNVGDTTKAHEQLLYALDSEPRSADALAALGDVEYANGHLAEAIRFYDRAATLEPAFPQLLPRRIITQVRRRKLAEADELAAKATTNDSKDPFQQAAIAYLQYMKGNQAEALNALQRLGEGDSKLAEYAKDVFAKVSAHSLKEMWTETFSRQPGSQLGRNWGREVGAGVNIAITKEGSVLFEGRQSGASVISEQPTMIWQERPGDRIYSFSVDLDMAAQPGTYAGIALMVYNQIARPEKWPGMPNPAHHNGLSPYTGIQVALSPDGVLVHRNLTKGRIDEWTPIKGVTYSGGPLTLEIRISDPKEGELQVLVNRDVVLTKTVPDLKHFRRTVELDVFCQAQLDRKVHFTADNVVVVTRKDNK